MMNFSDTKVGNVVYLANKSAKKFAGLEKRDYICIRKSGHEARLASVSGCSSVRLEYTSGGRGVASSNLVTPTMQGAGGSFHYFLLSISPQSLRKPKQSIVL